MSEDSSYTLHPQCLWRPENEWLKKTNINLLKELIENKYKTKLDSYKELHKWSIDNYPEFWEEIWHFTKVIHSKPFTKVIDRNRNIATLPEWFEGSRLNFAENILRFRDNRVAIYSTIEGNETIKKHTFKELYAGVSTFASAMKQMGVEKGDRVVGYIPNCIEAVTAMLATASIGAIWSSTSPEFGVSGVLDRFSQIQPKLLFSVNAVKYNNKIHDHLEKLEKVVNGLPDLQKVVIIEYITNNSKDIDTNNIRNSCLLKDFLKTCPQLEEIVFEQLPFNHPLFIMYSSGTTGVPKCMVHSAGGTLLKHLEEHIIHSNMNKDDVLMYYTTTGWMMWNWYVSSLAVGSAIVCYDGSPLIPHENVLWDLVDKIKITILGTGAKWLSVLEDREVYPGKTHNLSSLHTILSTGSPLCPKSFDYVYNQIKKNIILGSITGGTDIIACFAGVNPMVPVYRGEIQAIHLGIAMESWNEDGKAVIGESGELVCTKPFPSMPTHFWKDTDGSKYKNAYFNKFPGVWAHGDFCLINPNTGGVWMLGRSDGTLNPGGVRFGSAEIYHIVEGFKEISDSLCVGQQSKVGHDERVILFLKMATGCCFTPDLIRQVTASIRMQLSARHLPSLILETKDIPYTHSGKKIEIAVKQVISGGQVSNRGAFANPESLDLYSNIPQLQDF